MAKVPAHVLLGVVEKPGEDSWLAIVVGGAAHIRDSPIGSGCQGRQTGP